MHIDNKYLSTALFIVLSFWGGIAAPQQNCSIDQAYQCAIRAPENLEVAKAQIKEYYQSGKYAQDIFCVADRIRRYINSIQLPKNAAAVFDIDDTVICSFDYSQDNNFGYNRKTFYKWEKTPKKAIPSMLKLYNFMKDKGIKLFFISGRRESSRHATEQNLKSAGFTDWKGLYLQPEDNKEISITPFKSSARRAIEEQGYKIIVNIGDQMSDLRGGHAQKAFKIPNPIYILD